MAKQLPVIKTNKEYIINDFSKFTVAELDEIRDRTRGIIAKKLLEKLPDKGKKVLDLYGKIENEIRSRNEVIKAAELFSELNITSKGINAMNNMEWHGKYDPDNQTGVDSDDDEETDPIKILAQSRQDSKKVKIIKPEEKLITGDDLIEIESFRNTTETLMTDNLKSSDNQNDNNMSNSNSKTNPTSSNELEPHANYMCSLELRGPSKTKYLPHKTTKSDVHNVESEKKRIHGKHWENTAATPPTIRNGAVKMLSLQESIEIERKNRETHMKLLEQHTEERLAQRNTFIKNRIVDDSQIENITKDPSDFFKSYRTVDAYSESDDDDDYEDAVDDDGDDTGVSIVTYE